MIKRGEGVEADERKKEKVKEGFSRRLHRSKNTNSKRL
jgi:hypothetical protein